MSKKKKMSAAERIALKLASRKKESAEEKTSSSGLVFTSTTEFTQRLKSNMNDRLEERKQKKKKVEREAAETTKETKTSTTKTTATTTSSSTKKNVEMTSEPLVQSSMAATLSLLNRTYWCWSVRV